MTLESGAAILVAWASYSVNERAVARAKERIDARQYVLDSDWGDVQPRADAGNRYLSSHSWDEYAEWHLGLTDGARDETKARYAVVLGDFLLCGIPRVVIGENPPSSAVRTTCASSWSR